MAQQYPFVYYTPRDGLVNGRVRNIHQDSKGRMYFVTYGGLSVYDGVRFTNYSQQNGLSNELVNDVIEISPDSILVATNYPALNTLVHGKIGQFKTADDFYPIINQFLKSEDGFLYVVADDGLFKLVHDRFERLPFFDSIGTDLGHNLDKITEWKNYFMIIPWSSAQPEKLIIYDKVKQTITNILKDRTVFSTAVSPDGNLWISTSEGIEIPDSIALLNGVIKTQRLQTASASNPLNNVNIYFDSEGNVWLYASNQITILAKSGAEQIISSAQNLKASNLSNILVDREGITWISSDGNGVIKMPGSNLRVFKELKPGVLANISAMYQQTDTLWFFNITDNSFYRIHHHTIESFPLPKSFLPFGVVGIYSQGKSLYFTDRINMYRIINKNQVSSYHQPIHLFQDTTKVIEIGSGIIDPYGTVIQTLFFQDTSIYLSIILHHKVYLQSKISFMCDQMVVDNKNQLWVTTRDNHLLVFTLHPEDPGHYLQLLYDFSKEIEGISPRSLTVDAMGKVWIGTRYQGIFQYQWIENKLQSMLHLTTLQGLTDNFNYYLYCDPHNNIWAGSQSGLDKISFKDGKYFVDNITKSKNLFKGIFKIINIKDDVLCALTSGGDRIMITLDIPDTVKYTPSFFITNLFVNDQEYDESVTMFTHDQNNFSVRVAGTSFMDEKSILYSYWLKGRGMDKWSEPSNHAVFDFINLAPGSYKLYVKADFPAVLYPPQTLVYSFIIRPPYWSTWWFISVIILTILVLLGSLVRYYYSRKLEKQKMILEKKQALEKERTRIATDMHDDLGAGLSRIKFLSETIGIKQQQHLPIEDEINTIRHYSHDMIDKMGEIVWALNERNDSLSDLLSYTRAYAMEYLAANGLQCQIDKLPPFETMMVNSEFRRNIYLSVKEALHNVIKHAKASKVNIHFHITANLAIAIQDDGVGFDPDQIQSYGNGMNNIKKRMIEIGGSLEIMINHGTRILLTAPLPS